MKRRQPPHAQRRSVSVSWSETCKFRSFFPGCHRKSKLLHISIGPRSLTRSCDTWFAAKAGRDAYDQEHNGFFVQFNGLTSDLLWFGNLIEQRVLQQFNKHNATTDEYQRRWQFARRFGFSNGCTCSRPGLLSPSGYWYSDGAGPGDMLFEPEALYRGILYGAALAAIALSNGSRVSELLQVSLDRRITQTETVRVLDENGLPVPGEDGYLLTKQVNTSPRSRPSFQTTTGK